MNTLTLSWLVLLTLRTSFTSVENNPFVSIDTKITALKGSCVEMKCQPDNNVNDLRGSHWFWMKDATWIENKKDFNATIIFSSDQSRRPVDPRFRNRVHYIDSSPVRNSGDTSKSEHLCNILMCGLETTDSGNYSFRFHGINKQWRTNPETNLTVVENPCPITFEGPQVVKENQMVTLSCATSPSCPSNPEINAETQQPSTQLRGSLKTTSESPKTVSWSFNVSWTDDGRVFSCQTSDNKDKYLIRNISLTVEYAPKDIAAKISSATVKEGDSLTLSCSAKGQPSANFSWFHNDQNLNSHDKLEFTPIKASDAGSYYCVAENKLGSAKSTPGSINVLCNPEVEVRVTPQKLGKLFKEGDWITIKCYVKRSNPDPHSFVWFKDKIKKTFSGVFQQNFSIIVQPSDTGNYTCEASNTAGSGTSPPYHLDVQYKPRNTFISGAYSGQVKINTALTLTCNAQAKPGPRYSWYHDKPSDPSHWKLRKNQETTDKNLYFHQVQRQDEGCYKCNATNVIGSGGFSQEKCIKVLFPPTNVKLIFPAKVREGQKVAVTCMAESFPPSRFTVKTPASRTGSSLQQVTSHDQNVSNFTFSATPADAGSYTCDATNSEGRNISEERKLEVEYSPKDVIATAQSSTVKENQPFSLDCRGHSNPPMTSFSWKKTNEDKESTVGSVRTYTVDSAGPSDSGLYRCEATNEIGTGTSQQVKVEVSYAPKHTAITKGEEQQLPDGKRSVTLTCFSPCFPPATYVWYKKRDDKEVRTSNSKSLEVNSDQAGEYYCVAHNDIGQKSSEPIRLFDGKVMTIVRLCIIFFCILLAVFLFLLVRRWRKKSVQQGRSHTQPRWGLLGWCDESRRRNVTNQFGLVEPFRSRDDLLVDQPVRWPNGSQPQRRPDATSSSNITSVYSTVNLPNTNQPTRQRHGRMEDESLNYASLDFGNKQKKPEEDAVYSKVSRSKPVKEKESETQADYENLGAANPPSLPRPYDFDSETSEDEEEEVKYTEVNFKPKPGHQRVQRDSSTSEDETQYSQIKI